MCLLSVVFYAKSLVCFLLPKYNVLTLLLAHRMSVLSSLWKKKSLNEQTFRINLNILKSIVHISIVILVYNNYKTESLSIEYATFESRKDIPCNCNNSYFQWPGFFCFCDITFYRSLSTWLLNVSNMRKTELLCL